MKINLNSIFSGVVGCLLTLLFVFFFKPAFLMSNQGLDTNHSQESLAISALSTDMTVELDNEINNPECDQACVAQIVSDMLTGENLGNEFGVSITDEQAKKTADYLSNNSEQLPKIQNTLSTLIDQDARDTVLAALNFLPPAQGNEVTQALFESSNSRDRMDALSLLHHKAGRGEDVANQLKSVVNNDADSAVSLQALFILYSFHPNFILEAERERLNKLLSEGNINTKKQALIAKTKVFDIDDEVKRDIINSLNSPEQTLVETGIQVLDAVFSRQSKGTATGDWRSDAALRQTIETIANNKDAAPFTRVEALNLMRRHYY